MTIDEILEEPPAEGEGDNQEAKEGTDDELTQGTELEDVPSHGDPEDDEPDA